MTYHARYHSQKHSKAFLTFSVTHLKAKPTVLYNVSARHETLAHYFYH